MHCAWEKVGYVYVHTYMMNGIATHLHIQMFDNNKSRAEDYNELVKDKTSFMPSGVQQLQHQASMYIR